MSEKLLVRNAKRRRRIFLNLREYLIKIHEIVKRLDPSAEVYLFGSVAENRSLLSSDIDILVVTHLPPEIIISELWKKGIEEPFEIHVIDRSLLDSYRKRSTLIKITD